MSDLQQTTTRSTQRSGPEQRVPMGKHVAEVMRARLIRWLNQLAVRLPLPDTYSSVFQRKCRRPK